jgi:hypothetical protein
MIKKNNILKNYIFMGKELWARLQAMSLYTKWDT